MHTITTSISELAGHGQILLNNIIHLLPSIDVSNLRLNIDKI